MPSSHSPNTLLFPHPFLNPTAVFSAYGIPIGTYFQHYIVGAGPQPGIRSSEFGFRNWKILCRGRPLCLPNAGPRACPDFWATTGGCPYNRIAWCCVWVWNRWQPLSWHRYCERRIAKM